MQNIETNDGLVIESEDRRRNFSIKGPKLEKFELRNSIRSRSHLEKRLEMPKPFKESSSIKCKINFDKRLFQEVEKKNFSQSRVEKKRLQPTFGIITSDVHRNLLNKIAYDENIIKMRIGYLLLKKCIPFL